MTESIAVTESTFDAQVFKSDVPVLVNFRASWCAPCWPVAEWLPEIARTYAGHLKVVWVDVDQNSQITFRHRVRRIPTLVLFANGQEVTRWEGEAAKDEMVAELMPHLRLN